MNEINLDPHIVVDTALSHISNGPLGIEDLGAQGLERAATALSDGVVRATEFYALASVGFGEYTTDRLGWNWMHGLPFEFVDVLKTIAFFVSLILLILFVSIWLRLYVLVKPDHPISAHITPPQPAPGGPMMARWEEITRHLDSVKETEWKFAIIEADKLVEDALKKAGFPGVGLGERLSNISPDQLQSRNDVWEAHKLRNRIVHEINYFLRYTEAKHAIEQYSRALKELGSI